ncbi:f9eff9e6-76bf-45b6-bb7f-9f95a03e68e7 [Thermothielavioides terrestris]|nr:f9eff9e6-76bf-45b6-bb7f-9f95a03e68e7 [Thermothielavioides terrestris]
MSYTLEK